METTGKLTAKMDTQQVSDKFKKREFVLTIGDQYPQEVMFELTQDKCELISQYAPGSEVKVHFNLRGKKWEKDGKTSYFNKLEVWRIEGVSNLQVDTGAQPAAQVEITPADDNLPF